MSVQLQDRVVTIASPTADMADRTPVGMSSNTFRYDRIVLCGWMAGVFTLVVSLAMGCLIVLGVCAEIERDSTVVYACAAAAMAALIVLGAACCYERVRAKVAAGSHPLAE